ncbi:MAG: hemolysin family protein [Sphingopyxis sp.]|nr:hemolysin family protein [Sphingopyxis sp.]
MASSGAKTEGDSSSGGLLRRLKAMILRTGSEPTLREQIEDVIDEADEDAVDGSNGGTADEMAQVERDMLRNMLGFGEKTVDDVAVPRSDIIAIAEDASFADVVALFAEADHSRLPVYKGTLDDVVGMLHVKDVFAILAAKQRPPKSLNALMRQPLYVPQSMRATELLAEMRAKRTHLAIVLDEYGGTDGLLTIEDLVEEIVGDIEDEHDDAPEDLLTPAGLGVWDVDARIEIEEVAERLDAKLADVEEDVDTLGGLAFVLAGHVPQPGESFAHSSGWKLEIVEADTRRVQKLRLYAPDQAPVDDAA